MLVVTAAHLRECIRTIWYKNNFDPSIALNIDLKILMFHWRKNCKSFKDDIFWPIFGNYLKFARIAKKSQKMKNQKFPS